MLNYVGGRCVCAIETVHCTHICSFPAVVDADSLAGRSWLISSSTHKPISCRILQTYISSQKENLVKNKVFLDFTLDLSGKLPKSTVMVPTGRRRKGDRHEIILESKSPHISRGVDSSFQGIYLKYQIIEIQNT